MASKIIGIEELEMLLGIKYAGLRKVVWNFEDKDVAIEYDHVVEVDYSSGQSKLSYEAAIQSLAKQYVEAQALADNISADYAAVLKFGQLLLRGDIN